MEVPRPNLPPSSSPRSSPWTRYIYFLNFSFDKSHKNEGTGAGEQEHLSFPKIWGVLRLLLHLPECTEWGCKAEL